MAFEHTCPQRKLSRSTPLRAPCLACQMTLAESSVGVAVCLCKLAQKGTADCFLLARIELPALRRDVEHIDHFHAFCVDERHLDIAPELGECGTHVIEQAGTILGDEFEERAVG